MSVPVSLEDAQAQVDAARAAGDQPGLSDALIYLSAYLQNDNQLAAAVSACEEAVDIARTLDDEAKLQWGLENLASRYASAGRFHDAATTTSEQVAIATDRAARAYALILLSAYRQNAGHAAEAVAAAEEGAAIFRALGDPRLAWALENLAARQSNAGQTEDAVATSRERFDGAWSLFVGGVWDPARLAAVTTSLDALRAYLAAAGHGEEAAGVGAQAAALPQLKRLGGLGYGTALPVGEQLRRYAIVWSLPEPNVAAHVAGRTCGVPDDVREDAGQLRLARAGETIRRWNHGDLTYSIWPEGCNLGPVSTVNVIVTAFNRWENVAPNHYFRFQSSNDPHADLRLDFQGSEHDDFGEANGVVGSTSRDVWGDVSFDSAETWDADFLLNVAMHELGHALGLHHSSDPHSLMFPSTNGVALVDDESREQLRWLYGWTPQTASGGRSSNRPALAVAGPPTFEGESTADRLHLAYRGAGDDRRLRSAVFDGTRWSTEQICTGPDGVAFGSSDGPAMITTFDGTERVLHLAWMGPRDDYNIYWSRKAIYEPTWQPQIHISGIGTNAGPGLAAFDGTIWLAWRGVGDDYRIRVSTERDGYGHGVVVPGIGTSTSPALLAHRDRLYLFWRGINQDAQLYVSWRTAADPVWRPQQPITFTYALASVNEQHPVTSANAPTAVSYNDAITIAWRGNNDDKVLFLSTSIDLGATWSGQVRLADRASAVGPSICTWDGRLYLAWRGIPDDDDTRIFWSSFG